MSNRLDARPRLFRRSTWPEVQHVTNALRTETASGALLLGAALLAILWASSPWARGYDALRDVRVGVESVG